MGVILCPLQEISLGCSLEGMMLKLKLQYFGHLIRRIDSSEKTLIMGGIGGRRRRGRQRMKWLDGSAFFTVQLLHPYITTGKTLALTRWTFVGKVMSLFFNMLSRLVHLPKRVENLRVC